MLTVCESVTLAAFIPKSVKRRSGVCLSVCLSVSYVCPAPFERPRLTSRDSTPTPPAYVSALPSDGRYTRCFVQQFWRQTRGEVRCVYSAICGDGEQKYRRLVNRIGSRHTSTGWLEAAMTPTVYS